MQSLEQIDCKSSVYVLVTAARIFQKGKTISAKDVKFMKTPPEAMGSGDADAHVTAVTIVDSRGLQRPTWSGRPIEEKLLGHRSSRQPASQIGQLTP